MVEGPTPPSRCKSYYRAWSVLLLLFLVLGPFGLPLLWRSPSFSRCMKLTLTIVVLAYSVLLLEAVLTAVRLALEQMNAIFPVPIDIILKALLRGAGERTT